MTTVDNRVVDMKFNNSQFEQGIKQSMDSLKDLKKSLDMNTAAKNFDSLEKSANKVSFSKMEAGIEKLADRFSTFGIIGMTVIQDLTSAALQAGAKMLSALTEPILSGGKARSANLEAAQFQIEGLGYAWDKVKDDINYGVKDTAYGLDVAAKAAGQLLASNVAAGDAMKTALRGISGVAAMTNSDYESIADVFTAVAGNGRLMANELNRIAARGLNAAAALANYLGVSESEVRDMTSKGQIDFATFAAAMDSAFGAHAKEANKTFTGALSNMKAAFSRIGADFFTPMYTNLRDVINAFTPVIDSVHSALEPITKSVEQWMIAVKNLAVSILEGFDVSIIEKPIKSVASLLDTILSKIDPEKLKKSLGTMFQTFLNMGTSVANIGQAIIRAFKPVYEVLSKAVPKDLLEKVLNLSSVIRKITENFLVSQDLKKVSSIFRNISNVVLEFGRIVVEVFSPLKEVFYEFSKNLEELIPNDILSKIQQLTLNIRTALSEFSIGEDTVDKLKRSFNGLFGLFSIGLRIVGALAESFSKIAIALLPVASKIAGFILDITANVGDFISVIDDAVKSSNIFSGILNGIAGVIKSVADKFVQVSNYISGFFNNVVKDGSGIVLDIGSKISTFLYNLLTGILDGIKNFVQSFGIQEIFKIINIALLGKLALNISSFIKKITGILDEGVSGLPIIDQIKGVLDGVTGALNTLQTTIKSNIILKIAVALGILAAAVYTLSMIDEAKLSSSLGAIFTLMAQLGGAIYFFTKYVEVANFKSLASISTLLIGFSIALNLMAKAVKTLSSLSLEDLAKGLGGIGVLMAELALFLNMTKFDKLSAVSFASIVSISLALMVLSKAVKTLSSLNLKELGKGLSGMAVLMAEMTAMLVALEKMDVLNASKMVSVGVGLIGLATSMVILSSAISKLGNMSVENLAKGLISLASAMGIMVAAVSLMPNSSLIKISSSFLIMSAAIGSLSVSLLLLSGISWEGIAKSLIELAGALGIMAIACTAMQKCLAGAAAITVISGALMLLAPALFLLGSMSLEQIGSSLLMLAGVFTILGVAAIALGPSVGIIAALSGSVALLGVGLAAAGAGMLAFAVGLGLLGGSIALTATSLVASIETIAAAIPTLFRSVGEGIIAILDVIANSFDTILASMTTVLSAMVQALITVIPQIAEAITLLVSSIIQGLITLIPQATEMIYLLITSILETLIELTPLIMETISTMITGLLESLQEILPVIIETVMVMISSILEALSSRAFEFATTGADIVINFINGIASKMGEIVQAAFNLIISFINGLSEGIANNGPALAEAVGNLIMTIIQTGLEILGGAVGNFLSMGGDLIQGLIDGISSFLGNVGNAVSDLVQGAIDTIGGFVSDFGNAAQNLIQGFIDGITGMAGAAWDAVTGFANDVVNALFGGLGEHSPSIYAFQGGEYFIQGLINGIDKMGPAAERSISAIADNSVNAMLKVTDSLNGMIESGFELNDPVITPVIDMTNIDNGLNRINSGFDSIGLIDAFDSTIKDLNLRTNSIKFEMDGNKSDSDIVGNVTNNVTNNYDFTQNNTSPKALSRIDIYRQTNNQFNRFKASTIGGN